MSHGGQNPLSRPIAGHHGLSVVAAAKAVLQKKNPLCFFSPFFLSVISITVRGDYHPQAMVVIG